MQAETTLTLATLTSDALAETARSAGEPEWLIERRVAAWNDFATMPPPAWRRTNLAALSPEMLPVVQGMQGTTLIGADAAAEQGALFTTLRDGLAQHGDKLRECMGTAVDPQMHKFSALRAALWQDGVLLYVPRDTEIAAPLQVRYTLPEGGQSLFAYSVVILERGARVTFVEEFAVNGSDVQVLVAPTTEIFAAPGSEIRYITLQDNHANVHHVGGQTADLDRDAGIEWVTLSLGGAVQHVEAEARMRGDGSRVRWHGATLASGEQNLVNGPWLHHVGNHADSYMDFRTVVLEKGYSVFDGMIKIEHEARGSSTRLEQHAIHLNEEARSDSIPGLMIDTNDVASAGHASTSGEVDEEQVFYMQARGIDRETARRLIVMGFFEPALDAIPIEDMRERLITAVEQRIS